MLVVAGAGDRDAFWIGLLAADKVGDAAKKDLFCDLSQGNPSKELHVVV